MVEDVERTFQAEGPAEARAQGWTKPRACGADPTVSEAAAWSARRGGGRRGMHADAFREAGGGRSRRDSKGFGVCSKYDGGGARLEAGRCVRPV